MLNQVICKHDLIKFNKATDIRVLCRPTNYGMLQLAKLRLKNPADYRLFDWRNQILNIAMFGNTITLSLPADAELKFHDVTNPTAAECLIRNPETIVGHMLGLDLGKRAEKKAAKDIAKHFCKILVDITKFESGSFQIIPDPKSKVKSNGQRAHGTFFGAPADIAGFAPGKSYLSRSAMYITGLVMDGAANRHGMHVIGGLCFTVLTVDTIVPDERLPDLSVKQIKFKVVQGLAEKEFQTAICRLNVSSADNTSIAFLIETDNNQE